LNYFPTKTDVLDFSRSRVNPLIATEVDDPPADIFANANRFVMPVGIPLPDLVRQLARRGSG